MSGPSQHPQQSQSIQDLYLVGTLKDLPNLLVPAFLVPWGLSTTTQQGQAPIDLQRIYEALIHCQLWWKKTQNPYQTCTQARTFCILWPKVTGSLVNQLNWPGTQKLYSHSPYQCNLLAQSMTTQGIRLHLYSQHQSHFKTIYRNQILSTMPCSNSSTWCCIQKKKKNKFWHSPQCHPWMVHLSDEPSANIWTEDEPLSTETEEAQQEPTPFYLLQQMSPHCKYLLSLSDN